MQKNEYAPILILNRRSAARPFALFACLLFSVAAWGQIAYVTDGSGQDILAAIRQPQFVRDVSCKCQGPESSAAH